jgi:hypothetical protein
VRTPRACQPKRVNPTHGERVHLFAGASSSDRRHIAERGSVQDEICRRCQDRRNTCKWPRSVRDARRPPASGAGHSAFGISGSKRQPPAIRGAGYVLEPRSAAVDRESHRAYRTPSVFLIHATQGLGGENTRGPIYYAAAREPKQIWKVPGSTHTGGIQARPDEYERRVIDFFDHALLDRGAGG